MSRNIYGLRIGPIYQLEVKLDYELELVYESEPKIGSISGSNNWRMRYPFTLQKSYVVSRTYTRISNQLSEGRTLGLKFY